MLSESTESFITGVTVAIGEFRKAVSRPLKSSSALGYALTCLMRAEESGFACAVLLDAKRRFITSVCLKRHGEMVEQNVLECIEEAVRTFGASFFAVAHNHKAGILVPSSADLVTTELIRQRYLNDKVTFLDHYIVAGDSWITLLDRSICKKYITPKEFL